MARKRRFLTQKGWNSLLMIAAAAGIMLFQLPEYIKQQRAKGVEQQQIQVSLLSPRAELKRLITPQFILSSEQGEWQSDLALDVGANQLIQRWKRLAGTPVSKDMFSKLESTLSAPHTLEVWQKEREEPYRLTYYEMPDYWLMQNWQGDWFAVSVTADYLFPSVSE